MSAIGTRLAYVVLAAAQPLLTSCDQSSPDNNTAVSNIKFTDPLVSGGIVVRPPDAAEPLEDAQKPSTEFSLIGVKLSFERGFESTTGIGGGGGYEYEGKIEIGNPHTTPFHFDSIEISFGDGAGKKSARFLDSLAGETVILTEKSVLTVYHYGDQTIAPAVKNDPEHTPSDQVLEGHHAMSFHMSMASSLMPTICGKSFTTMRAQVMSNGKPVTGSYRGILPPIMKIPDEYAAKEENLFELRMWPDANIPLPSGIFDPATIDNAFQKIAGISPNAVLAEINPEIMTVNTYKGGSTMHLPAGWRYQFWSPDQSYSAPQVDPSAVKSSTCEKPQAAIDKESLKSCLVDIDAATMMLELVGAKADDNDFHCRLVAMVVAGKSRPVWDISYRLNGVKAYVFADTGQIMYQQDGGWKPFDVIWN